MTINYIVFHPKRTRVTVRAKVIIDNTFMDWNGSIWVDNRINNEDPFVFSDQWVYSYCHATQLRRKPNKNDYLTNESTLFFCTVVNADNNILEFDTIFIVDSSSAWITPGMKIPECFIKHQGVDDSELWKRHFKFGINTKGNGHIGQYTYSAKMYDEITAKEEYSFLPIDNDNALVQIPMNSISVPLCKKININLIGKRPVIINDEEKSELLQLIRNKTKIKVVKDIQTNDGIFLQEISQIFEKK